MITSILLASSILAGAAEMHGVRPKATDDGTVKEVQVAILGLFEDDKPSTAIPHASATSGSASISSSGETYWIDLKFDGEPVFKRKVGKGYVVLNFTTPIKMSGASVPEGAKKAIKSLKIGSGGNLGVRVDYDSEHYAYYISDKGNTVTIEIKQRPGKKVSDEKTALENAKKKEEEEKQLTAKLNEKKEAEKKESDKKVEDKKKSDEAKKKEAETKKAADAKKKAEDDKKKVDAKKTDDKKAVDKKAEEKKLADAKKKEETKKKAAAEKEKSEKDKAAESAEAKEAEAKKKAEAEKAAADKKAAEEKAKDEKIKAAAAKAEADAKAKEKEATAPTVVPEVEVPVVETKVKEVVEAGSADLPNAPAVVKEAKMTFTENEGAEQLRFDFPKMPAAAAFERFGYLWIVFDGNMGPEAASVDGSAYFEKAEKLPSDNLVYRLPMKRDANFAVFAAGNSWFVEVGGKTRMPVKDLRASLVGEYWIFTAKSPKRVVRVADDLTGDNLLVVPLSESPVAATSEQTNGDFISGRTFQGLAIRTISSGNIEFENDDIKIKKLSTLPQEEERIVSSEVEPIYEFQKWPQLSGSKYREAEKEAASKGKIEHANFLFSQGLYSEAVVRLKGFDYAKPNFLRGASNFMAGRYNEAGLALDAVRTEGNIDPNELLMWKIATNEMLGRYNPAGAVQQDSVNFRMPKNFANYPDSIQSKLLLAVAENFITRGRGAEATNILKSLPPKPDAATKSYADFLQGKIFSLEGKKARARELWQQIVTANTDRESRAKSAYEIIMLDAEAGKITPAEQIQKLDKLLIVWRGDVFEYNLSNKLAAMYANAGSNLKALRLYKQSITKFPAFPDNGRIDEDMKKIFTSAMMRETDDKNKIFEDLTTYYEFKELVPVGPEGDKIAMNLIDKLARYDLFEEAAKLLENHAQTVEDAKKKAEFNTRTGILYFMNRQPQKALDTLKATDDSSVPEYLREERRLVATRSLIDLGSLDAALIAAGSMEPEQKERIRAEIYWKQAKWDKLLESYKNVSGKTPDDVLKMAIANSILGNKTNLKLMRGQYGEMMAKSSYADDFEYISGTENINYRDLADSLKIDFTSDLIKKYRSKIASDGVKGLSAPSVARPAAAAPAPAAQPAAPAVPATTGAKPKPNVEVH